jgi:hypothetical protein
VITDLTWSTFKAQVKNKNRLRYNDRDTFYYIYYSDDAGDIETSILKDSGADQTDFETNYKSYGGQTGTPNISVESTPPFAQPLYRTKRNATASTVTVSPGSNSSIGIQITAERYVSGGCLVIENAEFGDYVTAEVSDTDGVIPSPYRSALCENWPVVAMYIEKEYIKVNTPGSIQAGSVTIHEIDTAPLNAKITPMLYLTVTYYAVNAGLDRRLAANYYLTKKL